jgi:hypothetical protein
MFEEALLLILMDAVDGYVKVKKMEQRSQTRRILGPANPNFPTGVDGKPRSFRYVFG